MGNANGKNGEGSAGVASGDYSHPYANSHQDLEHNNSRPKTTSVPVPVADKAKGSKVSKVGREHGNGISEEVDKAISLIEPQGNSEAAGKYSLQDFEPMKVIGNGCFGKVMMVKCKKNGKIYAMKTIKKAHVVKNNKVRHTLAERNIMQKINHPFVMKLHYAFQNNGKLYMVMDYLNGGDIFYHLSVSRRFPEERSKFYAAEVLMALECLHEHGFIYRDLKPENVLTDSEGHIRLTDFGLSKENFEEGMSMNTFVGTTEYLAPEVLKQKGYGKEVDWWSLGVLIFEMLTGCPPFYSKNRQMTFRMILSAELNVPEWLSPSAKAIIRELLVRDPAARLGSGTRGAADIKRHAFFSSIDFPALYRKEVSPPFTPAPLAIDDTSHFDVRFTTKPAEDSPTASPEEPAAFDNFSYQSPTYARLHGMGSLSGKSSFMGTYGSQKGSYMRSNMGKVPGSGPGLGSLPRINSEQDFIEPLDYETVIHPGALASDYLAEEDKGTEAGQEGGEAAADSKEEDYAVVSEDVEGEEGMYNNLGSSLIESSLEGKSPRWRQHDSQQQAKNGLPISDDDVVEGDEEQEEDETEPATETKPPAPVPGSVLQFGLDE
uniref:Protein kinase domain-containing protein n=1 Tax=Guillardia theta TaxID=55529 RepID=A0A7S4N677_GUITH|mmetsp:Transcript_1729/g.5272  ORF Transcript_1729/g.5272 Transcript_1729/m.5272 type:complete len:602 (+) Transcript_1729:367-2172(+)